MKSMETSIHLYLTKLRIISKIPTNGKIDTTNNDLNIYTNNISNWIWRKLQGDSKTNATKYLNELYKEINSFSDQLMSNINTEIDEMRKIKKFIMLVSLTEKIKESLNGIRNLIGTYKDFLKTISILECLEQDIIIPQYRILKNFIPEQYHTDIIRSSITLSYTHISGNIINTTNNLISMPNMNDLKMENPSPSMENSLKSILSNEQTIKNNKHKASKKKKNI